MHCDRLAATEREVVPKRPRVSEGLTGRNQVEVAPASLSQVVVLREIVRSKLHGVVRAVKQAIRDGDAEVETRRRVSPSARDGGGMQK